MKTFFSRLLEESPGEEAACILGWLLNDDKFNGSIWDKASKTEFTSRIRSLEGFGDSKWFSKKSKSVGYPTSASQFGGNLRPYALFSSGSSLGQDFVRHIRNGVAHGHVRCLTNGNTNYIELTDWGSKGQSAFVLMPLSYIKDIFLIYRQMDSELSVKKAPRKGNVK